VSSTESLPAESVNLLQRRADAKYVMGCLGGDWKLGILGGNVAGYIASIAAIFRLVSTGPRILVVMIDLR
jgi:hypothetical protein